MVDTGLSKRNQGWECPRCHATYAPWVSRCQRCYEAGEQKSDTEHDTPKKHPGVKEVVEAGRIFEDLYRTNQTHTYKITTPPPNIYLAEDGAFVVRGFAGEA